MATRKRTPVPKFFARIAKKDGNNVPVLKNRGYYLKYLNGAFKDGQDVTITIRRHYRKRTSGLYEEGEKGNQNGYLYAVVLPLISEKTGYSIDEACDALETLLCKQGDNEYGMPKILRFKDMNTMDFSRYVIDEENPDSVRSWALRELDLDIPAPNKDWRNKGYAPDEELPTT